MGKVILDAATRAKLNGLSSDLEFYDEQGNLLGYYSPVNLTASEPVGFTEAEIEEIMKDTDPGRPLAEIIADLRRMYP